MTTLPSRAPASPVEPDTGRAYTLADRVHVPWSTSITASLNAHFRAREHLRPDAVLHDPFAARLADLHPVIRLLMLLERWAPPVRRVAEQQLTAHVVRHVAVDRLIERALEAGFVQVVILGAGYDSRALRLGGSARWFEVDRPAMAAVKASRLRGIGAEVTRVPHAVGRGDLLEALRRYGWNPALSTCFVVEGLLHYLERLDADRLLAQLLVAPGPGLRRVVLSFIEPDMSRRVTPLYRELTRSFGEIPRTFFEPDQLAERFAIAGLRFSSWDYPAQVRDFAPAAAGRPVGLTQRVGEAC